MVTKGSELPPGAFVDRRYQVKCVLGRGGFGRTYLAADERRFRELCVLKEFVPKNQGDSVVAQKLYELFHREAKILHKLNHPQIPKFFAVFEENDRLFIVQEYIDGKTYWKLLQERQRQGNAFSEAEVFQWLCHLLPVLNYLHRQNIVHRDISPDNIMLPRKGGLPVLIDFGVVKQAAPHWYEISTINPDGSIEASVSVGKLGYAPYEQIRIGQCSPRSDLYALAVTAVVLLTAKPPNQLIDPKSLEWKWQSQVDILPRFAEVLKKMMEERPQDRYPSAEAVLKDLASLSELVKARQARKTSIAIQNKRYESRSARTITEHAVSNHIASEHTILDHTASALVHSDLGQHETETSQLCLESTLRETAHTSQRTQPDNATPTNITALRRTHSTQPLNKSLNKKRPQTRSVAATQRQVKTHRHPATLAQPTSHPPTLATSITSLKILVGNKSKRSQISFKQAVLLGLLALFPIGGMAVSAKSPYIASLCRTLNNCADMGWIEEVYNQATQQAKTAQLLSENAQSIDDLEKARTYLRQTIAKLRSLPRSNQLSASSRNTLPDYRKLLQHVEARLEKEERAVKLLSRAEVEARMATEHTQAAKTSQQFENARSLWRKVMATLSAIPTSSFVAEQASARFQEYNAQLQRVDLKLASTPGQPSASPERSVPQVSGTPSSPTSAPVRAQGEANPSASVPSPSAAPQQDRSATQDAAKSAPDTPQPASPSPQEGPIAAQPYNSGYSSGSPATLAPEDTQGIAVAQASPPSPSTPQPSSQVALSNRPNTPIPSGDVALSAAQTLSDVSVRIDGARVNPWGTYVANIQVENRSSRPFGFVPLFAEIRDASGQRVSSRMTFHSSNDAMVNPGEMLQGEVYLLDRYWNNSGAQDLTLVIREGTSGNRNFYVQF